MKKIKLVSVAVILLAMVMLFASCGKDFVKLLDKEYIPENKNVAYSSAVAVAALNDMTAGSGAGDLQTFSKYDAETGLTRYIVYDIANNKTVLDVTETKSEGASTRSRVTYSIAVKTIEESTYFTVTKTETVVTLEDSDPVKEEATKSVALWAWIGTEYAELANVVEPRGAVIVSQDLLYFEGKVYRVDKENKAIAYVFDYSELAAFPVMEYSTKSFYVDRVGNAWITYDKELKQISSFELPAYADVEARFLIGDQMFIQYLVAEDMYGDKYDLIEDGGEEKYSVHTILVDLEKGKAKDIKTDYMVIDDDVISSDDEEWLEKYGLEAAGKKSLAIVPVIKIENKRVSEAITAIELALINEKGKIKILEFPTLLPVVNVKQMSQNLWAIRTVDERCYLIDGEGEIKGELDYNKIDNYDANYFAIGGKLYDRTMTMLYDYRADKLEIKEMTSNAVLFTNAGGELIVYANGQKTTLINATAAKENTRRYNSASSDLSNYFVIVDQSDEDNVKCEIYNNEGKLVLTINNALSFGAGTVRVSTDGSACLVRIATWDSDANKSVVKYYRFA